MANQHYYSRVPARLSMYEKTDGFDTFAKSKALTENYISENLLPFCNFKLTQMEINMVRSNQLNTVYAQYLGKNNEIIQSVLKYEPLDFTGERVSYTVHSLVYSEEEKLKIVDNDYNSLFNKELFDANLDKFDITNKSSKPIDNLPELEYKNNDKINLEKFISEYDEILIKKLILALLITLTNKNKQLFISLNVEKEKLSSAALTFINSIANILPYHLRSKLSFITCLTEPVRFNFIKIKFVPQEFLQFTKNKGYIFDFTNNYGDTLLDGDFINKTSEVDFIYQLFTNEVLKNKFHHFYNDIVSKNKKLENLDLKDFCNLIFLYKQSCGAYSDYKLLPEDKDVLQMLTTYEQYRDYMELIDRTAVLKCINRYAKEKIMIPQPIFQKISKIYQNELDECKKVIMETILELIHTEVMREKLFTIIKSNYGRETIENRSIISEDLSRVFYGGFLQTQILNLFNTYFDSETEKTKNIILEKLILAIRTKEVQDKILDFISNHYNEFTQSQKEMIFDMFYEMLLEVDELSNKIIKFLNSHIELEPKDVQTMIYQHITKCVETDEKKKTKVLYDMIVQNEGPLEALMIKNVFTIWENKSVNKRVFVSFENMSLEVFNKCIIKILSKGYDMNEQMEKKLFDRIVTVLSSKTNMNLYQLISFDDNIHNTLLSNTYYVTNNIPNYGKKKIKAFISKLQDEYLHIKINEKITNVFDYKIKDSALSYIIDYSATHQYIKSNKLFDLVVKVDTIINSIISVNNEEAVKNILSLVESKECFDDDLTTKLNTYLHHVLDQYETKSYSRVNTYLQSLVISMLYSVIDNIKESNYINFVQIYNYCFERRKDFIQKNPYAIDKKSEKNFDSIASVWTIEYLLKLINEIIKYADINELLESSEYGINVILNTLLPLLNKEGNKSLNSIINKYSHSNSYLYNLVSSIVETYRKQNKTSLFAKLFGKKN